MKSPRQKARRQRQDGRDEDLRSILATQPGRRFIWRLITSVCHLFGDAFDVNDRVEARSLGQQSVGKALMRECQRVAPKLYLLMVREQTNADLLELVADKGRGPHGNTATT